MYIRISYKTEENMKNNMTEYKKRMQAVLATVLVSFLSCVAISAQTPAEWEKLEGDKWE